MTALTVLTGIGIIAGLVGTVVVVVPGIVIVWGSVLVWALLGENPYRWWVLSTALGNIISAGDSDTAVYEAYAAGVNSVHVEDANGILGTIAITRE